MSIKREKPTTDQPFLVNDPQLMEGKDARALTAEFNNSSEDIPFFTDTLQ